MFYFEVNEVFIIHLSVFSYITNDGNYVYFFITYQYCIIFYPFLSITYYRMCALSLPYSTKITMSFLLHNIT